MKLTPIINNKMRVYQRQNNFDKLNENELFEHFVNQMLLMSHNATAFSYIESAIFFVLLFLFIFKDINYLEHFIVKQ